MTVGNMKALFAQATLYSSSRILPQAVAKSPSRPWQSRWAAICYSRVVVPIPQALDRGSLRWGQNDEHGCEDRGKQEPEANVHLRTCLYRPRLRALPEQTTYTIRAPINHHPPCIKHSFTRDTCNASGLAPTEMCAAQTALAQNAAQSVKVAHPHPNAGPNIGGNFSPQRHFPSTGTALAYPSRRQSAEGGCA